MQDYIVNIQGFSQSKDLMTVLLDDGKHKPPTYKNITEAFRTLSEACQPGDVAFVHFSGNGCRVLDAPIDAEVDSYDEAIIPCDFTNAGLLRDTLIFKTLIAPMKKGVTVTCVFDACDTGVVVELPYSWKATNVSKDGSARMAINEDFSFVRFLKVIKTLYDSSTFTQLGRTVRGVLDEKSPTTGPRIYDDLSDASFDEGSLVTVGKENEPGTSFFGAFAACHLSNHSQGLKPSATEISDLASVDYRSVKSGSRAQSGGILQQMLNCALPILYDADEGHSVTQRTRHEDDSFGDDTSATDLYSEYERSIPRRRTPSASSRR